MVQELRQARILAMQALSQWEAQREENSECLTELFASRHASSKAGKLAGDWVRSFWSERDSIDRRLQSASSRWALERMATVDRNVMRVAVIELTHCSTPPAVILDEAIEIAREYGGTESPRFVNGVLDQVLRTIQEETG